MSESGNNAKVSVVEKFEKTGFIDLAEDLLAPAYRVAFPVRAFIRFHVPREWDGQPFSIAGVPLTLSLNGTEILNLSFHKDCGTKKASVDLTPLLKEGENVLEVESTVLGNVLPHTWGKFYLLSQGEMKIRRTFRTRSFFEQLTDKWILHFTR